MPTISVIIPTYNRPTVLLEAINSVLGQTYQDFEVIIVDDGSRDETRSVVEGIRDPRLRYIYQSNAGLSAARNTGLAHARGNLIAFLDDDDIYLPNKLEIQERILRNDCSLGLVVGKWYEDDEASGTSRECPDSMPGLELRDWLLDCQFIVHASLFRREWAERAGGFDTALWLTEDHDYWLRLSSLGCKMVWADVPVCVYRRSIAPTMRDSGLSRWSACEPFLLDKYFSQADRIPDEIAMEKDHYYAVAYLLRAIVALQMEMEDVAKAQMCRALACQAELLTSRSEDLDDRIVAAAKNLAAVDQENFFERAVRLIPVSSQEQRQLKFRWHGRLAFSDAVAACAKDDRGHTRAALLRAIAYDRSWIRNPGTPSMLLQSIAGRQASRAILRARRAVTRTWRAR
jgi:glycosyltransferase involved in cell wall biosynthesis